MTTNTEDLTKGLSCDAIDITPRDYDFGQGYAEHWDVVYPDLSNSDPAEMREVAEWYDVEVSEDDDDLDPNDIIEAIQENDPDAFCPMMNYIYPLPHEPENASQAQIDLIGLPVTVVMVEGEAFLALTGGGMDLSWEICEAYIRLGYLPPLHFAGDLPLMAGMRATYNNRRTIAAARKAIEVRCNWGASELRRIDAAEENLLEDGEVTP